MRIMWESMFCQATEDRMTSNSRSPILMMTPVPGYLLCLIIDPDSLPPDNQNALHTPASSSH